MLLGVDNLPRGVVRVDLELRVSVGNPTLEPRTDIPVASASASASLTGVWQETYGTSPVNSGVVEGIHITASKGRRASGEVTYGGLFRIPAYELEVGADPGEGNGTTTLRIEDWRLDALDVGRWRLRTGRIVANFGGADRVHPGERQIMGQIARAPGNIPLMGMYAHLFPEAGYALQTGVGNGAVQPAQSASVTAEGGWRWVYRYADGTTEYVAAPLYLGHVMGALGGGIPIGTVGGATCWEGTATASATAAGKTVSGTSSTLWLAPDWPRTIGHMEAHSGALVQRRGAEGSSTLRNWSRADQTSESGEGGSDADPTAPAREAYLDTDLADSASLALRELLTEPARAPYSRSGNRFDETSGVLVTTDATVHFGDHECALSPVDRIAPTGTVWDLRSFYLANRCSPHWLYPLDARDDGTRWRIFGAEDDRQFVASSSAFLDHPALPAARRKKELANVIAEPYAQGGYAGGSTGLAYAYYGLDGGWWGCKAPDPIRLASVAPARCEWDARSAPLWSVLEGDGLAAPSLDFQGSRIAVNGLAEGDVAEIALDLGSWTVRPAMLPRLLRFLTLGWGDGLAVVARLEGLAFPPLAPATGDPKRTRAILATTPGTREIPAKRDQRRTGSYLVQYGEDDPTTLAPPTNTDDAGRVTYQAETALSLLSSGARSWDRLVFRVTRLPEGAAYLDYPSGPVDLAGARLARESTRYTALLIPDGPAVRFGGEFWDAQFDQLLNEPHVYPGHNGVPTAGDGAAWLSAVILGIPAQEDPFATVRRVGWCEGPDEEWFIPKHLYRSAIENGFEQRTRSYLVEGEGGVSIVFVSSLKANPPSGLFPRRKPRREDDWRGADSGSTYGLHAPTLGSLARDFAGPLLMDGTGGASVELPAGYPVPVLDLAGAFVDGWEGRRMRFRLTGDEGDDLRIGRLGKDAAFRAHARIAPHKGALLVWGDPRLEPKKLRGGVHNLATRDGRFAVGFADPEVGARVRTWDAAVPAGSADASVDVASGEGYVSARVCQDAALTLIVDLSRVDGGTVSATSRRSNDSGRTWSDPEPLVIPNCLYPLTVSGYGAELVTIGFVPDDPDDPESPGVLKGYFRQTPDAAPGPVRTLVGPAGTIRTENRAFGHHPAREGAGRWILTAVPEGQTSETSWGSTDVGDPDGFSFSPL